MADGGFGRALPRVLVHEGGYVNDPDDPGGATNKGVTFKVYDAYRVRKGLPTQSVKNISAAEVSEIYKLQYWDAVKGDHLPAGVDYVLFDGAVNSGPTQSVKWLQRALGTVTVDGQLGQATLQAVEECLDLPALIDAICDRRLAFLKSLRTWARFGGGWSKRVAGVRKVGKAWSVGAGGGAMDPDAKPTRKAPISSAKRLPAKAAADLATGSGAATGGLGGALNQAKDTLEPLAGSSSYIATIVAALVVAGVVLMAGGMAYRWYAARKAKQIADALDLPQGVAA